MESVMNFRLSASTKIAFAFASSFAAATAFSLNASAQTPPGRMTQTASIVNMGSNLCLAIAEVSSRDGVNVQQGDCRARGASWDFIDLGGGEFALSNRDSGRVLDVTGSSNQDSANVQQYGWNSSRGQRWRIESVGNNQVRIVNAGSGKCLDVDRRATNAGANVSQYSCHNESNQLWRLDRGNFFNQPTPRQAEINVPVAPAVLGGAGSQRTQNNGAPLPPGRMLYSGMIVSRASSRCVDVEAQAGNQGNIRQWTCNGGDNQLWDVYDVGRGEVAIVSRASGRVMDVQGGGTQNGANIGQYNWTGGANQRWRLDQASRGFSRIISAGSSKCVDLDTKGSDDGANILQWECHGRPNQEWRFEVRGAGDGWTNYQTPTAFLQRDGAYYERPPEYAVGTWSGYSPTYRSDMELSISPDGFVTATIGGNQRLNGYYRNGEVHLGTTRFALQPDSRGLRATQVGKAGEAVIYKRTR
jgi:Ricin-type beta-trefoil lectin domain